MKTNIKIEISDAERLDLGQKYHNTQSKRLLTRDELREIVQEFVHQIIDSDTSVKNTIETTAYEGSWRKIYHYNGRKITKREWLDLPDGDRKFYSFED
jgi:hypothetical protein|tara:strand:- start:947 stop:1240 length:294 start_codon:yes stop_codon:yes gene_type:complete